MAAWVPSDKAGFHCFWQACQRGALLPTVLPRTAEFCHCICCEHCDRWGICHNNAKMCKISKYPVYSVGRLGDRQSGGQGHEIHLSQRADRDQTTCPKDRAGVPFRSRVWLHPVCLNCCSATANGARSDAVGHRVLQQPGFLAGCSGQCWWIRHPKRELLNARLSIRIKEDMGSGKPGFNACRLWRDKWWNTEALGYVEVGRSFAFDVGD